VKGISDRLKNLSLHVAINTADHPVYNIFRITAWLILVFSAIMISGVYFYILQKDSITREKRSELFSIVEFKVKQISDYRTERYSEANFIFNNQTFITTVNNLIKNPGSVKYTRQIDDWLLPILNNHDYEAINIIDPHKQLVYNAGKNELCLFEEVKSEALKSLVSGKIIFGELQKHKCDTNIIHLEVFVPLLLRTPVSTEKIGIVQFVINPNKNLFQLMQSWPTKSPSAEILVVRKDKDSVLFLNNLRFKKNAALVFRLPLNSRELPSARGLRGETGIIEGIDYRGVKVLAAIKKVPDSNWLVVTKIDHHEVFKGL
jgi:hypothetical protein